MKLTTGLIAITAVMNGLNVYGKTQTGTQNNLRGNLNKKQSVLGSATTKQLKTGTYVETDRNQNDFKNLGVNLFDNVFIGFLKVNTDGSILAPENFDVKKSLSSDYAQNVVSIGGATYTTDFRACLNNQDARIALKNALVSFAQQNNVKLNFDFEFPNSDQEATNYMQLIKDVINELDETVSVALPYMTKMKHMLHNDLFQELKSDSRFKSMAFIYDMTREAGCDSAGNCWTAYQKGSCLVDTQDLAQIQRIDVGDGNGGSNYIQTKLSGDSYLDLLKTYYNFTDEDMSKLILGMPTYTAVHKEPVKNVQSWGAPDEECGVHQVTLSGGRTDYIPSSADVSKFVSWADQKNVSEVFIYEAGYTSDDSYSRQMTSDVSFLNNPINVTVNPDLCDGASSCVGSNVTYGDNLGQLWVTVSPEGLEAEVSFSQSDINYYAREFGLSYSATNTLYNNDNVQLLAISNQAQEVATLDISSDTLQSPQIDRMKSLFENVVPGGRVEIISEDSSNKNNSDSWLYGLFGGIVALGTLYYCLRGSCKSNGEYLPADTAGDSNNSELGEDQPTPASVEMVDVSQSIETVNENETVVLDEEQRGSSNLNSTGAAYTPVETIAVPLDEVSL